jgi:hypothetical protein
MTSKRATLLITSKMQKEIQCAGSGPAKDKLLEAPKMTVKLQDVFMHNTFHGKTNNSNSTGMVTTIISGTGVVEEV